MWRFKPFIQKEQTGLEGRAIDVGNLKIHVLNAIAEGGFSCVYLARDAVQQSKQYALKHIICNDEESLDLVKKEMSVTRVLRGHPNIVTLAASDILDMGRRKEAFFVMEFCEKSLVNVLESRGTGYYEEKQVLLIFRDICNAVFAMHCQAPPIAHRDLKVENVLLGSDGAWKLCDFGSTSTNHKCFDRPEEMGIEEDNIRKHTTPAYRAPEMWDLLRREVISEKVDIWALGCFLYRICFFKLAFDGESKLQILNGNYRIPDLPKYSSSMTDLIKDMLQSSPESRPDITQVWFRVNLLLPEELQKQTPDPSHSMVMPDLKMPTGNVYDEGVSNRAHVMPRRSPPPPPSRVHVSNSSPQSVKEDLQPRRASVGSNGMFWSTQHAQETQIVEDKGPVYDEEPNNHVSLKQNPPNYEKRISPPKEQRSRNGQLSRNTEYGNSSKKSDVGSSEDFEIRFDSSSGNTGKSRDLYSEKQKTKASTPDAKLTFQNEAFNNFVAEFDTTKFNSGINNLSTSYSAGKSDLEAEVERLKEELKIASLEKAEITSKYDKLSAICRSQRQEIQELKQALAAASPSHPNNQGSSANSQSFTLQREKIEGTMSQLQQAMSASVSVSSNPDPKSWKPFAEEPTAQPAVRSSHPKSVRTNSSRQINNLPTVGASGDSWGFGQDSFAAVPMNSRLSKDSTQGSTSQRFQDRDVKKVEAKQPAGWAGF